MEHMLISGDTARVQFFPLQNHPQFLLHFLIHIDVLMLCRKFELIPTNIFRVIAIFKNRPIFEKYYGL